MKMPLPGAWIVATAVVLGGALGMAPPQPDSTRAKLPQIEVSGDWGKGSPKNVQAVLQSCSANLMRFCPDRQLGTILVRPRDGVPITLDQKGPHGEDQVLLGARDEYWCQYAYQFSHELAHILSNYDRRKRGRNLWFEEALCETSSMFTLRRLAVDWKARPPYPNWREFAPSFDQYVDALLAPRERRLPPDRTLAEWFREHEDALVRQDGLTVDSKLVAVYLLPLFEDEPAGWESLAWINLGPHDAEIDFRGYLRGWKERVPERRRSFVGKIERLFGME
jgi:hypothetical protein